MLEIYGAIIVEFLFLKQKQKKIPLADFFLFLSLDGLYCLAVAIKSVIELFSSEPNCFVGGISFIFFMNDAVLRPR